MYLALYKVIKTKTESGTYLATAIHIPFSDKPKNVTENNRDQRLYGVCSYL